MAKGHVQGRKYTKFQALIISGQLATTRMPYKGLQTVAADSVITNQFLGFKSFAKPYMASQNRTSTIVNVSTIEQIDAALVFASLCEFMSSYDKFMNLIKRGILLEILL